MHGDNDNNWQWLTSQTNIPVILYSPYAVDLLNPWLKELMSGVWDRDRLMMKARTILQGCGVKYMTRH